MNIGGGFDSLLISLVVWSTCSVGIWSIFGKPCLSLSTEYLFWIAWDDSPWLSLLLDLLARFLEWTTCHAGDLFGSFVAFELRLGNPLWYTSSMFASQLLSSLSLPGSPMLPGPDLHRGIALHGVYRSHSVFIRLFTGCLAIHKLIRWMFMNSMGIDLDTSLWYFRIYELRFFLINKNYGFAAYWIFFLH